MVGGGAEQRRATRRWLPALASLGTACSLVLGYPDPAGEASAADCADGIDNEGDGLVDCDDPSCGRCVLAPRIPCPSGWTRVASEALGADTCAPPAFSALDGCPSEVPEGAVVVDPGRLAEAVEANCLDERELWLAPGRHELLLERSCGVRSLRGLCEGGAAPLLVLVRLPSFFWNARVRLQNIVLELAGATGQLNETDVLELDRVEVVGAGTLLAPGLYVRKEDGFTLEGALVVRGSSIRVPIAAVGSTITVSDSLVSGIVAPASRVRLERVWSDGTIYADGAIAMVDATSLFVANGDVRGSSGSTDVRASVVENGQVWVSGSTSALGTTVLEDVVAAHISLSHVRARLERVRAPVLLGDATGSLRDLTVDGAFRWGEHGSHTGLTLRRAPLRVDRVDVRRIGGVGVVVTRGDEPPTGMPGPELSHIYVQDVGHDDRCDGSLCEHARAGIAFRAGESVTLTEAWVSRVDGCGVFVSNGGPSHSPGVVPDYEPAVVRMLEGRVEQSAIGLCSHGRTLETQLELVANTRDVSTTDCVRQACECGGCP